MAHDMNMYQDVLDFTFEEARMLTEGDPMLDWMERDGQEEDWTHP